MNNKQKIVLRVGIVIIVLMGLFPPVQWTATISGWNNVPTYYHYIDYQFLFITRGTVALSNLVLQWILVSIIAGGFIYINRDKKQTDEQNQ